MKENKTHQLIIIGGGPSIKDGIVLGLWEKIKYHFTIGTNFSYKYFKPVILTFVDKDFYEIGSCTFTGEEVLEHRQELAKQHLIVGQLHNQLPTFSNTLLIPARSSYDRTLATGAYHPWLCGIFALTVGIWALDYANRTNDTLEIYLLGMDWGEKRKDKMGEDINEATRKKVALLDEKGEYLTHFYGRDIVHGGTGKVDSFYNQAMGPDVLLAPYKKEKKVQIYNVSPQSRIPSEIFPKIGYSEFFQKLKRPNRWKLEWAEEIRTRLEKIFI
jgi:hypothetical protein